MARALKIVEKEEEPPYEPSERERDALEAQDARRRQRGPQPSLKVETTPDGKVANVYFAHEDVSVGKKLMLESLGTSSDAFYTTIIAHLGHMLIRDDVLSEKMLNGSLALTRAVQPRDEVETMLAVQMTAVHNAVIKFARRAEMSENVVQSEAAERSLNRLARTFATQMEALKRYRSKGEQRVVVEHVTVNEGGQAIVGDVNVGGGGE